MESKVNVPPLVEGNKASFLLNNFLKICGIKETITATKIVNIQQTYTVKEQLSFYVTNVKKFLIFKSSGTNMVSNYLI